MTLNPDKLATWGEGGDETHDTVDRPHTPAGHPVEWA